MVTFEFSKILVSAKVLPVRERSGEKQGRAYISCWIVDWVIGGPLEVKSTSMRDILVSKAIEVDKRRGFEQFEKLESVYL